MNILLVENNNEVIEKINNELNKTLFSVILVKDIEQVEIIVKNSNNIDVIITSLDFQDLNCIKYLEIIRRVNQDTPLVILSSKEFNISVENFINLKIEACLNARFLPEQLHEILNNIKVKLQNSKLNQSLKEFSLYSETDLEGNIVEVSESLCKLTGYKKEELIGQKHSIIKHPNDDYVKYQDLWQTITKGATWSGELQIDSSEGETFWYKTIIFPIVTSSGKISGYGAKRQDITIKKHFEKLSIIDSLTGLYNRRHYDNIFLNEIKRAKRTKEDLVFMIIDIDNFKLYNDYYGHPQGDIALQKIANILQANFKRANDFIIRLGGEEFVIITSTDNKENTLLYAERIRQDIEDAKIVHEKVANKILTVSIGVFISIPEHKYSENEIYNFADIALYKAKRVSGNCVVHYNLDWNCDINCTEHIK